MCTLEGTNMRKGTKSDGDNRKCAVNVKISRDMSEMVPGHDTHPTGSRKLSIEH